MKFISEIFQDAEGGFSSKRFVTLFAFFLFATNFLMNLFQGKKVDQNILDLTFYLIVAGLGTVLAEKFTKKSGGGIEIEAKETK